MPACNINLLILRFNFKKLILVQIQAATLPDSTAEALKVRVITPSLARAHEDVNSIPLLWNGRKISGQTTLRELKGWLADFLGLCSSKGDQQPDHQECNCVFARQICKRGIWKRMNCCGHSSSTQLEVDTSNCRFAQDDDYLSLSHLCALCSRPLADHHTSNDPLLDEPATCRTKVFLRTDLPCQHMLHSSCVSSEGAWTCPTACSASKLRLETVASDSSYSLVLVFSKLILFSAAVRFSPGVQY